MYTIPANISTLAATIIPIAIPAFLLPLIPPSVDESSVFSSTSMWFSDVESSGEGTGAGIGLGFNGDGAGGDETGGELAGG